MGSDEMELTATLEAAAKRRMDLHDALVGVEKAISGAAPGRVRAWADRVGDSLEHLQEAFDAHIRGTEEQGGLYDEILDRAPHLAGKVKRLRDEHPHMQLDIAARGQEAGELPVDSDEESIDAWRDDVSRLLGRIVHHRQHGADLVWEAYNVDLGGMG
jgi:hypothetical protein